MLKKYAEIWGISTDHFDPARAREEHPQFQRRPIEELLVEGSDASRQNVKRRLYQEGLKERRCELCGQDENWRGQPMALILDHINGVRDDNRLENLRIVCPNCAATFSTHCGRKNRIDRDQRRCRRCDRSFVPNSPQQRYCSRECGTRWDRSKVRGKPQPSMRRTNRPPYEQLLAEIEAHGYCWVGRKYGVSDNAVRKWVKFYERELERSPGEASG